MSRAGPEGPAAPDRRGVVLNRRRFLRMTTLGSGAALCGFEAGASAFNQDLAGKVLGPVPFVSEGLVTMDTAFGSELDGRLYSSLDGIDEKSLLTPEQKFYLRTRASQVLPEAAGWVVTVDGLTATKRSIPISELRAREKALGLHLMECAGNTRAAHFGMISVGDWAGAPIAD